MTTRTLAPLFLGALVLAAGCSRDAKPLVQPNVDKNPVVFESGQAESLFTGEVGDRYEDGDADVGKHAKLSRNAYYNNQLDVADSDGDGIITDAEAYRYAGD